MLAQTVCDARSVRYQVDTKGVYIAYAAAAFQIGQADPPTTGKLAM